jgi:serine/threonine-protein kinase
VVASRSCLSTEEIALYLDGAAPDIDAIEHHVEGCESCRRCVAGTIRAGRRDPVREPTEVASTTITAAEVPALALRLATQLPPDTGAAKFTLATLRDEEVRAARTMIRMGRWVGLASIVPVPLFGGELVVELVFTLSVIAAIVVGLVIERRIRRPERYTEAAMLTMGILVVVAGLAGMLYYGIFSAAQLFPVLTIYVFSRRERFRDTLVVYGITAVGQAILAALVLGGAIGDPGLFEPVARWEFLVIGHVLIQIGDLAAFLVGRQARGDTRTAIENMQHAMLLAARREVLLQEVQEDLDRAMRIGGAGRYTDQTFGAYRLGHVLGRGGMGEVYEAHHVESGEPAAVKLLMSRELGNPRSVARFVREVRAVTGLRSRHVVRVLASSAEGDPIPYLVMERLRGQDLAQYLRGTRLTPEQLLELLAEVGAALEEAWEHGLVHRDLKPHNLYSAEEPDGRVWKVLDFGVASLQDHGGTLTEGHIIGTPAYMAPEQARGERVDYRADLYALSAIAYRCLTGRPVCSSGDIHAVLYEVVHRTPPRPSTVAKLDPDVDAVLAIGLAKDPAERWARVEELRSALADALVGRLDPRIRQRADALLARHPWSG